MASVDLIGLDELTLALAALPDHLAELAGHIVQDEATQAYTAIVAAYETHHVTGNLARGVKLIEQAAGRYGAAYQVKSTAHHAWLFEHGTEARHTHKGWPRGAMWSKTPPHPVLIPEAMRHRRSMYQRLADMIEREGFEVSVAA